jgi:hypothetical protein
VTTAPPGPYSPLPPVRICDTRAANPSSLSGDAAQCNGTNNAGSTIAAGHTKTINVAGEFGVPADATAVVLNVTVVNPAAAGQLIVFPAGAAQPLASNLNYSAGEVVPNLVEVGTASGGEVSIYSLAKADIVVDLEGYVAPTALDGTGSGLYNPLPSPARLCDTRKNNPSHLSGADTQCNGTNNAGKTLAAGGTLPVKVAGDNAIPANAIAAVLNVTVINPGASGFLTVYPEGTTLPTSANVNYTSGQVTGNRVIVPLSTGATPGWINIYSKAGADVVVDVSGYYTAAGDTETGTQFTPEPAPARICDTRANNPSHLSGAAAQCNGTNNAGSTIAAGHTLTITATGLAGVPTDAKAVVVNLTGVSPSQLTNLTVFPGPTLPTTSDLNLSAHEVKGNLTVATISSSGKISIYNNSGTVDVVVDVMGWYS